LGSELDKNAAAVQQQNVDDQQCIDELKAQLQLLQCGTQDNIDVQEKQPQKKRKKK